MVRPSDPPAIIEFGHFSILPHRRELRADGRPIRLGGRAFDVLTALIEASGAVVSKDELLGHVWQDRIVEENRLAAEIATLRKAFGSDRELIRTVTGAGLYQFTGVTHVRPAGGGLRRLPEAPDVERARRLTNLSEPVSELIGRDAELSEVTDLVTSHRLVTLIGEGGIGKTRLGIEVVRHLLGEFPDGVWIAELGSLSDPDLVPAAVTTALRLDLSGGRISVERVANALRGKRFMLLLDNCEHVIAAAAETASSLLRANAAARVLATSREPLRIEGECLYRVPPLAVPLDGIRDVDELLRHGSVRLFVARARTADPHFAPEGRLAIDAATICRHLDGIPLAIELAAGRSAALGVAEVAARLDDRFHLLTDGHRTALPRHQTLRATLDWSFELLSEPERKVLRRLAIFAGGITLAAASVVAASGEITASDVVDCVAKLIIKSLVAADGDDAGVHYRLLETTRALRSREARRKRRGGCGSAPSRRPLSGSVGA
jgi:predicted ATPase/DNA-binding winged helix-turn-helix (wHTH) protein